MMEERDARLEANRSTSPCIAHAFTTFQAYFLNLLLIGSAKIPMIIPPMMANGSQILINPSIMYLKKLMSIKPFQRIIRMILGM